MSPSSPMVYEYFVAEPLKAPTNDGFSVKHEDVEHVVLAFTRHKRSMDDVTYTYRIPLCTYSPGVTDESMDAIRSVVESQLGITLVADRLSIVSRSPESGVLAFLTDAVSLGVAVVEHSGSGKKVINFYVVRNDGKLNHEQLWSTF